jgi:hypothetical protein
LVKKKNVGKISKVDIKFLRIIEGCTTLDKIKNEITWKGLSVHSVRGRVGVWDVDALETPTSTYNHCPSVICTVEIWRP